MKRSLFLAPALLALAACGVTPTYVRPAVAAPASFEEDGPWRLARPGMADDRSPWWQAYGDPQLDALVTRAVGANQTLKGAEAQLRQSQALAQSAASAWWPTLGVTGQATRQRAANQGGGAQTYETRAGALQASWEPDFWGRVRASTDAADATARASEADLAAARLTVQASVVNLFAQIRVNDALIEALQRTIDGYAKSLKIAQSQLRAGVATPADVALAQSTLASAQAQLVDVQLARKQGEHALAVLLGVAPADFHLPAAALTLNLPVMPPQLPSQLLERRPDISAAESRVQAANAQIGVARAAWFPHLVFDASGGGTALGLWTSAPQRVWALGAALTGTLFDGGQRAAQNAQAEAAFDQQVAGYRQTVLGSFQEVEDNLAALRELATERDFQEQALAAARESERVLLRQYQAGTTTYVSVINAQALSLNAERTLVQLRGREFAASVALTKALGGGYSSTQQASTNN